MFHIVLHEPEIPPNAGNAIRLCANTGATLHLVQPLGFRLDDKSLRRSGLDYHKLAAVKVHANLEDCIGELAGARLFTVETSGQRCYADASYRAGDAFLFGSERRGLPPSALRCAAAGHALFVPMRAQNRSINLSNTVALVIFEAWRQIGFAGRDA